MLPVGEFIAACRSRNYSFFTGVPCSYLKPIIDYVFNCRDIQYMAATSEGEAMGLASGAYLAGRKAVVMGQNSGLGNMINPLTSLNFPFRIPLLLIITLRGDPDLKDEPQHELMGQITTDLLETLHIPWCYCPDDSRNMEKILDHAQYKMERSGLPFALIVKKGNFGESIPSIPIDRHSFRTQPSPQGIFSTPPQEWMSRREAICAILEIVAHSDALICSTGKIAREVFSISDSENHFYMVGSMGCAASIGCSIQYLQPKQRVMIMDGDGALLMKMGTLATIGYYKPRKFIHFLLDNEAYESTGGQRSVSPAVDFSSAAAACGYEKTYRIDTRMKLNQSLEEARKSHGPQLFHVKVSCKSDNNLGRPTIKPDLVKQRFMRFLEKTKMQ